MIKNLELHNQIKNDETQRSECSDEKDWEVKTFVKTSVIPKFMPKILPDDEIAEYKNSLNLKLMEALIVVHKWSKDYVKYNGHYVESVELYFSCSGRTGKSHLVKVIYNAMSKTLIYYCKDPEKLRVLLEKHTGISAVNIGRTAIYSEIILGTK